ncbi:hypothetical protein [Nocardioides campestrisoli]|uniref:hypothetical protein n=1 Tax=Nocardioides campestrisoli TaxID=2736757 RepID=UPI00163DD6C1|nr:hypothetical protein [Nocardioides campestrisoli]
MRLLLRAAVFLFGSLLLIGGVLAAVLVGPDDTLALEADDAAGPVVTHPRLTAFTDVTLVAEAEAPGGVFVGAGHRVDVDDLVSDVARTEITGVRSNTLLTRRAEGSDEPLPDPVALDLWTESTHGDGPQLLALPLTGDPVAVVATPLDPEAAMTLSLGARVDGLFAGSLAAATSGLALLVVLLLLRRRRRRRPAGPGAPAEQHSPGPDRPVVSAGRASPPGTTLRVRTSARPRPTLRLVAPLLGLGLLASGCTLPAAVSVGTAERPALTPEQLPDLMADLDRRLARANKKVRPPKYDDSGFRKVFTGPHLRVAQRNVASAAIEKHGWKGSTDPTVPGDRLFAPAFETYPMWAALDLLPPDDTTDDVKGAKERRSLLLVTRESVVEPWMVAGVGAFADLPEPTEAPGPVPTRVIRAAQLAADHLDGWWRTGQVKGIRVDRETKQTRAAYLKTSPADKGALSLEARPYLDPNQRLRVVETADGYLAIAISDLRQTTTPPLGITLTWNDGYADLNGTDGDAVYQTFVVTAAIHLPTDGRPRLLGTMVGPRAS